MQFQAVSLVDLALWLAKAFDASSLAAHAIPVPDAALAKVVIKPLLSTSLCLTSNNPAAAGLSSCNGDSSQTWIVNAVDGNIVQFQNAASNLCLSPLGDGIGDTACNNPRNGHAYSNTEWLPSQAITQAKLPMVVTGLDSQLGFVDTGLCLDRSGSTPIYTTCNGGLTQSWYLLAA